MSKIDWELVARLLDAVDGAMGHPATLKPLAELAMVQLVTIAGDATKALEELRKEAQNKADDEAAKKANEELKPRPIPPSMRPPETPIINHRV